MTHQPFHVITVDGNIGVGKTTLLPKLATELTEQTVQPWEFIEENVDSNEEFQTRLAQFTADPSKHRISFQNFMTDMRHQIGKSLKPGTHKILERSLLSDLVFSIANIDCSTAGGEDICHIHRIHQALQDYVKISTAVYLKALPQVCYQRMLNRGRESEKGTPYEYIEHLSNCHDTHLPHYCKMYDVPLLTVNYSQFMPVDKVAGLILNELDVKDISSTATRKAG